MLRESDDAEWLRMRDALWPGLPASRHRVEMSGYRSTRSWAVFVADRGDGRLGGFLELGRRTFAEGYSSSSVHYIEGWYVDSDLHGSGVGRTLVEAAERYARESGGTEIASDCLLDNEVSRMAHRALGYEEVHPSIHFRKALNGG